MKSALMGALAGVVVSALAGWFMAGAIVTDKLASDRLRQAQEVGAQAALADLQRAVASKQFSIKMPNDAQGVCQCDVKIPPPPALDAGK